MNFEFSGKLKIISFVLMAIGAIAIVTGFLSTPKSVGEAVEMIKDSHGSQDSGSVHLEYENAHKSDHSALEHSADDHTDKHAHHTYNQLKNRPWSALYYSILFFTLISLAVTFFYVLQTAAQAGWSIILLRVMEGIASFLPIGAGIVLIILISSAMHWNHLFHWMETGITDSKSANYDSFIYGKSPFLNTTFFIIRTVIYIIAWVFLFKKIQKLGLKLDQTKDISVYKKMRNTSALFLVVFAVTSSIMAWDWIMSLEPHWFSTLFGWYIFGSSIVSGVTTIAFIALYLKSKGYLEYFNDSHLHDLAKFMFGFSIFWTYLWFSQYILYWYSNIPEEITYFTARFDYYLELQIAMLVFNFLVPVLVLINSDFKRIPFLVTLAGISIILGHTLEVFCLVMPGTVGTHWHFGFVEIGTWLGVLGLFIFVVFTSLTKRNLLASGNPFVKESKLFHY